MRLYNLNAMQVTALKTKKVIAGDDLISIIEDSLATETDLNLEGSVLVVTSKIVAIAEGSVVNEEIDKHDLVAEQADLYIDPHSSKYNVMLTIKDQIMAVNAGVDESNVADNFVLLPKDSYKSAAHVWQTLKQKYKLENFGVVICDSTSMPLKWGTVGRSLAHCGFEALNDMRGQKDLFGRELKMTQMNIAEGIAAAAVLEMGEGNESTPLAVVSDISHIDFVDHQPSGAEIKNLAIEIADDVYAPIITSAPWQKGKK